MLTISTKISPALLNGSHAKQLPYALSKTINEALKGAQSAFLPTLSSHFHLRGKSGPSTRPGTALGFNIQFSTKARLEGTLGSRADWWALQETGGNKEAEGHRLAIPLGARPNIEAIIPRKNKPRSLLVRAGDTITRKSKTGGKGRSWTAKRDAKGFKLKLSDGREGIFVRTGPDVHQEKGAVKGGNIRLWYMLTPRARIKPALGFFSSTEASIAQNVGQIFNREFDKAVATAS